MSDRDEYCWSHHDDWNGPDSGWNDRGMGMSAFDGPEEERRIFDLMCGNREQRETARALGWEMSLDKRKKEKNMMNEMKQAGACERKSSIELPSPDFRNRPAFEMSPYSLSDSSKKVFVLADKARKLLTEAFEGLPDADREVLRKMVAQGTGNVDPKGESLMAVVGKAGSLIDRIVRTVTDGFSVQTFEIWREGFEDEDGKEGAVLLAKDIPGADFADAVSFWYRHTPDAEHIYGPLVRKGGKDRSKMWLWGCRLYDNEQDARRRFG